MKSGINIPRLVLVAVIGIGIAVVAGLHALAMIATRTAPDTALRLFPGNAAAQEQVAFKAFSAQVTDPEQIQPAAAAVREQALNALRADPSSAKALALLAMAQPDIESRHAAALAASRINRRDLALQGLVLEAHLAAKDYPNAIETLDQILRVHPTYAREFFPVLGEAMRDERTLPVFARLLDGSSPWHERFLQTYAVGQKDLLRNLALLRAERELVDEDFDRDLIARLARNGQFAEASMLYQQLTAQDGATGSLGATAGVIEWTGRFPPFDWRFTDEGDFRAQASRDGSKLELFVRPGRGGVIADRIIAVPQNPFAIRVSQDAENPRQSKNVRIELTCPGDGQPFLVEALKAGENTIAIGDMQCEQVQLAVNARAFSGQAALRSDLSRIEIVPR